MADNYGPEQPEVFDIKDRSWESVVFGRGIPVKSADWNLIGQIADDKARQAQLLPSGWLQVGEASLVAASDTASAEGAAVDGQIITSVGYQADTFKLISKGGLRAVVNGWPLVIQGTDSVDINNVITLESMASTSGGRLDFVFLEVWRELVDKNGVVYQYGNTDADTLANDLDTAKRIQLRYRIRVSNGISGSTEGFDGTVYAAAALPVGSVSSYTFSNQVDAGDAGLWLAGDGSSSAKTALGSVDGYSYAIPMFMVYRRGHSAGFSILDMSSTAVSKGDGVVSDRPDGYFYDVVYPTDIVDLRHRILVGRDISALVEKTFKSLTQGTLRTRRGLVRGNSGYVDMPGGSLILKGEEFGSDTSGLPRLGTMQSTGALPQRALCNATITHRNNIVSHTPGAPWSTTPPEPEYIPLGTAGYVYADYPVGAYRADTMASLDLLTDIVFSLAPSNEGLYITIPSGSTLIGSLTPIPIKVQLEVDYLANGNGLLDVPENILSIQNNLTGAIIPAKDGDVIAAPGASLASEDYISHRGAEEGSTHDQGIEVVTHITLSESNSCHISLVGGKLHGHELVGIKGVQRKKDGVYGPYESFGVTRYPDDYYVHTVTDIAGGSQDVRITFLAKTKFFETSRQGRGITETYETLEVTPLYIGGEFYYVDTGDKPLLAICQAALSQGGYAQGLPYAYVNGQKRLLEPLTTGSLPMVNRLPIIGGSSYVDGDYLPTRVKIEFQGGAVLPTDTITVPVIVHSNVSVSESYTIFYTTTGYQGTSSSVGKVGSIEFAGPHLLTTSGSGVIKDYSFAGTAKFGMDVEKRLVEAGTGVNWLGQIKAGDYISKNSEPAERYRVAAVTSGTQLVLEDAYYDGTPEGVEVDFTAIRKDIAAAGPYGIIDRMPTTTFDGWRAQNQAIWGNSGTMVSGLPYFTVADPSGAIRGDVKVGNVAQVAQGRTGLLLSIKGSDRFQLVEQYPDVAYGPIQVYGPTVFQKIFQSYLFVEDATGILYLAVVTGETQANNDLVRLTGYTGTDVVDVFEIIGRPLAPRG